MQAALNISTTDCSSRNKWGRADLISDDGEVWEVKRDKPRQIRKGIRQVNKYVDNEWKQYPNRRLSVGEHLPSKSLGLFTSKTGDTYSVWYRYAENGVIAYDYKKVSGDAAKQFAVNAGKIAFWIIGIILGLATGAPPAPCPV